MSQRLIAELSSNKMVLDRHPIARKKTVWNFVTPKNWRVGDVIIMEIHLNPYEVDDVTPDGKLVITVPPEPPNGWKHEFYKLYNTRTKDQIYVDFDSSEAFERLEKDYRDSQKK
jgi:hypothetical protein